MWDDVIPFYTKTESFTLIYLITMSESSEIKGLVHRPQEQ